MLISDQIKAFDKKLKEIKERMATLLARAGDEGRTFDQEEESEHDSLEAEAAAISRHLDRLRKAEQDEGKIAAPVEQRTHAPAIIRQRARDDDFEGQSFTRMVIAKTLGKLDGVSPALIAKRRWGSQNPVLVDVVRAAVEGGASFSDAWGEELVQADARFTGDFIEYLTAKTVYDQLALRQVPANVTVKGQDGIGTGYWVGEGKAIPVSAQDFMDVTLTPLKVGAISVVTKELLRDSSPAAEMLVRDGLVEASGQRVDGTFISTSSASAGAPAGILNGVTPVGSGGTDADGVRADIKSLVEKFIGFRNASGLVIVMNPTLALAISLMRTPLGVKEFEGMTASGGTLEGIPVITGDNVGASHMILLKPSDIYRIGDSGVEVSVSQEAAVEMDNAPQGDSQNPTASSANLVSLWQTESVGLKIVRSVNFAKRRSHAAQYVSDAAYGTPDST